MEARGALRVVGRGPWLPVVAVAALVPCCGHSSPRETFDGQVAPVLEQRCVAAQCHGVAPDAESQGQIIDWNRFFVRTTSDGRIADLDQAYATSRRYINTVERAEFSTLLRKPLGVAQGDLPHLGGSNLQGPSDPAYVTIRDWIASESDGGEGTKASDLTPNQQLFATTVMPKLVTLQCMNAGCHDMSSPLTAFQSPVAVGQEQLFPTAAIAHNYYNARMHLFLGGDPLLSRIVRKGLPLDGGGIAHRPGNDIFFHPANASDPKSDPTVAAIAAWADAERAAVIGPDVPALDGIVFVRGPIAPEPPFVHDVFVPGKDLWVLSPAAKGGALRNLTASAHSAPADVRDPAVSHDGRRVAFAMRTSMSDAFNIYEMNLDGSGLHALTSDRAALPGGGTAASVQPTYGPDGRIYFVSTRAGFVADDTGTLDTEIWRVDPHAGALERWTYDPAPEVTPSFIGTGQSYGALAFTMLRQRGGAYKATVLRMPVDHNGAYHADPSLHPHHGMTIPEDILYGMRTMPDARFVATTFDRSNVWRGGRLVVFDRELGPELPAGSEGQAAVPAFLHAFTNLDATVASTGPSAGGFWRDPAPLPDGRIVVARAQGAVDLTDVKATLTLGLWIVTLHEDRATRQPQATFDPLLVESGVSDYDPEPIVRRPLEDDPSHALGWNPSSPTAHVELRHVETLEAIAAHLRPTGAKPVRTDIWGARIVVPAMMTPSDLAKGPLGAGSQLQSVIVGEAPHAGGSYNLEVPKDTPFRVQFLDADKMAVGGQLTLWPFLAPGEHFGLSVDTSLYPIVCGTCHGSLTGDPTQGVGGTIPDTITTASVTLATHDQGDPRKPLAPVAVPVGGQVITVDFQRDVLPIMERSCATASCHAGATPAGGLDLGAHPTTPFDSCYQALLAPGSGSGGGRKYVDAEDSSAYQSYVTEVAFGRELGAPRPLGKCPGGTPALSDDEKLVIVRWIDLGALYRGQ